MTEQTVGVLIAIFIAACSLAVTAVGLRRKTDEDYTARLERQVEELRGDQILTNRELDECKRAKDDLQRQAYSLLAEIHTIEQRQRRLE